MLLTKRLIEQGESPKIDLLLWSEEFWRLTKSERNKYIFTPEQVAETQRMRKHKTPKEIGELLGVGTFKIHQIINMPILISLTVRKKGVHDISKKVQRKIDRINVQVAENQMKEESDKN